METHNYPDWAKVQGFCLTLTGEARLWYETLGPIEIDWTALQEHFRQQLSKFGSTREQYFHVWRSFHYDENTDTIDPYISKIKQVAVLLNYGEPQILELFKNTLPSKLYWILFPINNLRDTVDAAKRVLTKEKSDKHLSGQAVNSTPFMKMGDTTHSGKEMSINAQDSLGEKIENLTSMMYKMSIKQEKGKKPFRPQVYAQRGRGQRRQNFDIEIGVEIMIGKDKSLDRPRIDAEIITEEVTIGKILVGITAGIEVDKTLGEIIVIREVDQEEEAPHPEGMVIGNIVAQT